MSLASSVSDLATRIASYLKTSVLPRLLPAGGAAGQVLAKSAATDYSVSWVQGWTSANFNPANYAALGGAAFTGAVSIGSTLGFGSRLGQHLNLYGTSFGFGIQDNTLYARTGSEFAFHVGGSHVAAQGDPGTGGTNLMRLSASLFTYKGSTVWGAWNFDPNTKANLAGATFTGAVILGGNASTTGSHRVTGTVGQFALQDRTVANTQDAVIYHQGQRVRFWWGADQFSIDNIGWTRGGAYGFNNGKSIIYSDANLHNIVARTGDDNAQKFFVFGADGAFSTLNGVLRSASDVFAGGRVIVGEGKTESWIEMRDSDEGTRYIHNNANSIGFLTSSATWGLRSFNDGNIWTPWFGYLSDALGAKLNRGRVDLIDFNGGNSFQPVIHKEGENWYMLLNSDYSVWSAIRQNGYIEFNTNAGLVGVNYWTSDADYKENIEPSQHDALSQVAAIPFVEFNYKPGAGYDSTVRQHGFLAQDIEMINSHWVDETSEGRKQPSQPQLLLSSLRSIQQLTELVARQDEELQLLRERIQRIEDAR